MNLKTEITGIGMRIVKLALPLSAILALLSILVLVNVQSAMALEFTISAPDFAREGDVVPMSFIVNESGEFTYRITLDDEIISENSTHLWHTTYSSAGQHSLVFYLNTTNESHEIARNIYIQDVPLSITFQEPEGTYTNIAVPVAITTSYPADICTYQYRDQEGIMQGRDNSWTSTIYSTQDGLQEVRVSCTTAWDEVTAIEQFSVDTQSPRILGTAPTGVIRGDFVQMIVETDEEAWCRYGQIDEPYQDMDSAFDTNQSTSNTAALRGLSQGIHTYYVRCADQYGHSNTESEQIQFTTNLPPSVVIEIDQSPPLTAGMYYITMSASENIIDPELSYNYQDGSGGTSIAITGEGRTWNGYLLIPEGAGEKILIFAFRGTDESGLDGTEITNGKIALVDTIAPGAPTSLNIKQSGKAIKLEWTPASDDYDYFKIYESEIPGVTTSSNSFPVRGTIWSTTSIKDGQTRAYRVSAVDSAGNEGPQGPEVSITYQELLESALATSGEEQNNPLTVSPGVLFDINQTLTKIDVILLQAEAAKKALESLDGRTIEAIEVIGALADARLKVNDIRNARNNAESVSNQQLDEETARKTLKRHLASAETAFREMPRSAKLEARTEYEQTLENADIERATQEYTTFREIENTKEFISMATNAQDGLKVIGILVQVRVQYGQGSKEYTIVRKDVLMQDFEGDIVEIIPKTFAQSTDEIHFMSAPEILNKDPVVSWKYTALPEKRIEYFVEGFQELTAAQASKTFAIPAIPEIELPAEEKSLITGAVTGTAPGFSWEILLVLGGIVVVGLAGYYFFAMKAENGYEAKIVGENVPIETHERMTGDIILPGHIKTVLNKAHEAVDANRISEAYSLSLEALKVQAQLSAEEKAHSDAALSALRTKLAIHKAIDACHSALDRNDKDELLRQIQYLKSVLHSVEVGSPLFSRATKAYDYFSSVGK